MILTVDDIPTVHVAAAEVMVAQTPMLLQTVLGSCVAAVFWSPRLEAGAMCHGALPECPRNLLSTPGSAAALRYVDHAIRHLADRLCALGTTRVELHVKLFGGADVLPLSGPRTTESVGRKNCMSALRTLEQEGLRLLASDLGGTRGRVIYFSTATGEVFLRRLQKTAIVDEEALPLLWVG